MRIRSVAVCAAVVVGLAGAMGAGLSACSSSSKDDSVFDGGGTDGSTGTGTGTGNSEAGSGGGGGDNDGDGGLGGIQPSGDSGPITLCEGLQCNIKTTCASSGDAGDDAGSDGTTITGKIMDPSGANPIYNVLAYVPMYNPMDPNIPPAKAIQPITGGVTFPAGVTCDSCSYLYTGNPIAIGTSGTDGTFTIKNAPSGTNIPIVIQVGKWRTHTTISTVSDCTSNDAGIIKLPSSADGSDPIVSIPQIAISMGRADSLECLPYRLGIDPKEFVSGAGGTGHVHIFTGGGLATSTTPPDSSQNLWDSLADLNKYDVTLLSCEFHETTNANPQLLEQYVNGGGRAFASHYHYSWFTGPEILKGQTGYTYTPNADWGSNLATWNPSDTQGAYDGKTVPAKISSTLTEGGSFPKGIAMEEWLTNVGATGAGADGTEVPIVSPALDAKVTTANPVSQSWATFDDSSGVIPSGPAASYPSAYFTFNTPVNAQATDGGAAPYCGRVVFSGLHAGAAAADTHSGTAMPSNSTCNPGASGALSPQEKVLEFMLFDLSSCVTPDTAPQVPPVPTPPIIR